MEDQHETLLPPVRNRKKKRGSAGSVLSQTINISKGSWGQSTDSRVTKLISSNFQLKTKEERKLFYVILAEVEVSLL